MITEAEEKRFRRNIKTWLMIVGSIAALAGIGAILPDRPDTAAAVASQRPLSGHDTAEVDDLAALTKAGMVVKYAGAAQAATSSDYTHSLDVTLNPPPADTTAGENARFARAVANYICAWGFDFPKPTTPRVDCQCLVGQRRFSCAVPDKPGEATMNNREPATVLGALRYWQMIEAGRVAETERRFGNVREAS